MIVEIQNAAQLDKEMLRPCHYGRKMLSCYEGYGIGYDFCRFFSLTDKGKSAVLMLQNSTLLVSSQDDFSDCEIAIAELGLFVKMHQPFRVEGNQSLLLGLKLQGYQTLRRSIFQLKPRHVSPVFDLSQINTEPKLDDVYQILSEGFPNLISYDLWLTDTSHMIRHGLRHCYTYFGVTAATAVYDYENHVLVGQVATRTAARGKGYARDFLHWIAGDLQAQGKDAILYALDIRASFYQEIGFPLIATESVWERLDAEPNAKQKEAL
ncbi:MAG: N-acetyltransferase [Oscillospiraceae bacterium]|nr:N-acetyltransferase [Oscillospiraceae bacterium]